MKRYLPDWEWDSILAIPLAELRQQGIVGLIFDLDNTITAWHSQEISEPVLHWFAELKRQGFRACILSNSDASWVEPIAECLGIPFVASAGKPRQRGFRNACVLLDLPQEQVLMVGDQLLTDVGGAHAAGLKVGLVPKLYPREHWGTKHISRRIERLIRAWHRWRFADKRDPGK